MLFTTKASLQPFRGSLDGDVELDHAKNVIMKSHALPGNQAVSQASGKKENNVYFLRARLQFILGV